MDRRTVPPFEWEGGARSEPRVNHVTLETSFNSEEVSDF